MKVLLKIFGALFLIILAALIAIPFLLEGNIEKIVRRTAENQVNAEVDFSKIELSLIRDFPKASVTVNDLKIINRAPFEKDTLVNAKEITGMISFSQLFKGFENGIAIDRIIIDQANVNVLVNTDGKANYDIAMPSSSEAEETATKEGGNFNINLNYEIKDSKISYHDTEIHLILDQLNHSGKGDVSAALTDLVTETKMNLSYKMHGVSYASKMPIYLNATFEIDTKKSIYTFQKNEALINHIPLNFTGFVKMLPNDDIDLEIDFETKDASFKNLLSAIPNAYQKDINGAYVNGKFSLNGGVHGIYNEDKIPFFDIHLKALNSAFKYPDLPKGVDNINLIANVVNKTGKMDDTKIDVDQFTMKIDQDTFAAEGHFYNLMTNIGGKITANGTVNLANLHNAYPVSFSEELKGIINANLNTQFTLNDIENEKYERIKRNGKITLQNFEFVNEELPNKIFINNAAINFATNKVTLEAFQLKTGKSDLSATGTLENLLPFVFADKVLQGNFDLNANRFNVSDFLSESTNDDSVAGQENDTTKKTGETEETDKLLPGFLDIATTFLAKEVIYDNLNLKNTSGKLFLKERKATLKDVNTDIFGGTIAFNGILDSNTAKPSFDMQIDMKKLSIVEAFSSMELFQKITPIASALEGLFSTTLNLNGVLKEDLTPNLSSLKGNALASLINAEMNPAKNNLVSSLDQKTNFINLNKISLKDWTTNLNFEEGKVKIKPFNFKINDDINVTASGAHAFDGDLDYTLSTMIPAKYLGNSASGLLANLSNQEIENMQVPLPISLGGSPKNPKIGLDLKAAVSDLSKQIVATQKDKAKAQIKTKVKEEVNKQLSSKAKETLGGILGKNNSNSNDTTAISTKKLNKDAVKEKAGKLIKGLFK